MRTQIENFTDTLQKRFFNLTKSFRQVEKNLYSLDDFKQRLAIEKRRSERLNYKSSIVFFNLKNLANGNGKPSKLCMEEVTKLICANIRATDVVSLIKNQTILILLPDTNSNDAPRVCKRLVNKTMDSYSSSAKLTYDDFHIKIISFPEKQITEKTLDDYVNDNDDGSFEIQNIASSFNILNQLPFKRDYFENLNLCLSTFNSSTIFLPIVEVFFWDQQLVSKYLLLGKNLTKRTMDIIGAIIGIILFLPIMLITALVVKITSPGPILFKQCRIGYKGKYFIFLKFRSMFLGKDDCMHRDYVTKLIQGEKDQINHGTSEAPFYKIIDDPRITPFGRFLRKTSLDELPQFINVLKGEMSLVGPRAPIPYEVTKYQNWHFRRILEVKPGITGLWQVSGRSRTTFDEMVRLDIRYAKNCSLLMDLKILFKTVKAVFSADGT